MMKYSFDWICASASLGALVFAAGCNPNTELNLAIPTSVQVFQAPTEQCQSGGQIIRTFRDQNADGRFEPGEEVVSETPVCNGVDGTNGASAHLTTAAATPLQCPAGGVVYTTSVDGRATEQAIICNGINGQDGADGSNGTDAVFKTGAVGPQVSGKVYSACHHDYVYLPGTNSTRGWLIFRHQANGTADQGIGSTGFQVWTVDISDFLLSSEVGNVTYCRLHWDPQTLTLDYAVLDRTDGLQGLSGTIHF